MKSKVEAEFQAKVIEEIKQRLPGCYVLKNDPNYMQGIPDLLILYKKKWAMLETKRGKDAPYRPNQEWYLKQLGYLSFASVIFPENKEEVLDALERSFKVRRSTRVSVSVPVSLDKL